MQVGSAMNVAVNQGILKAQQLSAGYGGTPVVHDVSIEIGKGEILALVGPNGTGKSTLLKTLAGLLRPVTGQVLIGDDSLSDLGGGARARAVAYCPQQESAPDWPLTVSDVVSLGRTPHRGWISPLSAADRTVVQDALERTGLTGLSARLIGQLSGGEWQRVLVARSLAQQPSVLLLDEPVAYLDLKHQQEVLDLIRSLAGDGLGVVITLHDLTLAAQAADCIALMMDGRIAASGPASAVFKPELLSAAYGIQVSVVMHPVLGTPMVVPDRRFNGDNGFQGKEMPFR